MNFLGSHDHQELAYDLSRFTKWTSLVAMLICAATFLFAQSPNTPAEFVQGTQAMREGKLEEARVAFAAAAKRQPAFAEAHFNLGLADEELGKYDEALTSLREALRLKPHLRGANLFLGISEFRLNRLADAAASVQKETLNYPKDA